MKKKKFDFIPSEYQEKIFDFVENGSGNAVIEARAGSGKTSTCVAAIKLIPKDKKCLYIAFNKSIAEELNNRLKTVRNATARTTHSLGYLILRQHYGIDMHLDEYKYTKFLKENLSQLTTVNEELYNKKKIDEYISNIKQLINFSRFYVANTEEEINKVAVKYDIPVKFDECWVVKKCLEWGMENLDTIDFADMIWIPVIKDIKPFYKYDWVFLDEAQDASVCSTKLFMSCIKPDGRFVAVGDQKQMINVFAGSSDDAFEFMKNQENTTVFNLPISYRCPKNVIKLAQTFVSDIKARDDAPDGEILNNISLNAVKDGDMVLCRSKAPLVTAYTKLLKRDVNCYIKGADIGVNMIDVINNVDEEILNTDLSKPGVFSRLYMNLFEKRNRIMETLGIDFDEATLSTQIIERYDMISALEIIALGIRSKDGLIDKIHRIFKEDSDGICLSTIHKAKGLESDNVYILCNSSMPSKSAKHKWQQIEEENIMYVAYTRPKYRLAYIDENEIKPAGIAQDPITIINDMMTIERIVCKLYGKQPTARSSNVKVARLNLQNIKEIKDIKPTEETVIKKNIRNTPKNDNELLSELEELIE